MREKTLVLFLLLVALVPARAEALYLRMDTSAEVSVAEDRKAIDVSLDVTNDGDEDAKDVRVEFLTLNESHLVADRLPAGEKKSIELKFSFSQLGLDLPGDYLVPYRVLYRDTNFYAFSSSHMLIVSVGTKPSRVLNMLVSGTAALEPVKISDKKVLSLTIQNVSQKTVEVRNVFAYSAVEVLIATQASAITFPTRLQPSEKMSMKLIVQNSGVLRGSVYMASVIASGVIDGKHFSEDVSFQIEVVEGFLNARNLLMLLVAVLALAAVISWAFRKKMAPSTSS